MPTGDDPPCGPRAGDPDAILAAAIQEMREALAAKKEDAVIVIAMRNHLRDQLEAAETQLRHLQRAADSATSKSPSAIAHLNQRKASEAEQRVEELRHLAAQAADDVDQIQASLRQADMEVRLRAFHRLAACTAWSADQIKERIDLAFADAAANSGGEALQVAQIRIQELQRRSDERLRAAQEDLSEELSRLG